jgi:hypothetical protein
MWTIMTLTSSSEAFICFPLFFSRHIFKTLLTRLLLFLSLLPTFCASTYCSQLFSSFSSLFLTTNPISFQRTSRTLCNLILVHPGPRVPLVTSSGRREWGWTRSSGQGHIDGRPSLCLLSTRKVWVTQAGSRQRWLLCPSSVQRAAPRCQSLHVTNHYPYISQCSHFIWLNFHLFIKFSCPTYSHLFKPFSLLC